MEWKGRYLGRMAREKMDIRITRKQFFGALILIVLALFIGLAVGSRGAIYFQATPNPGHHSDQIEFGDIIATGDITATGAICDSAGCIGASGGFVGSTHDGSDCANASGTIANDALGNEMCKFTGSTCPGGWLQYDDWSTTTAGTSNYVDEIESVQEVYTCNVSLTPNSSCTASTKTCTSDSHGFANKAREFKTCFGQKERHWKSRTSPVVPGNNYGCNYDPCFGATNTTAYATITEIGCY